MKLVSDFHPRHPIFRLCRGLFYRLFVTSQTKSSKAKNNEQENNYYNDARPHNNDGASTGD